MVDMDGFLLAAARDGVDVSGDCDGDGTVDFVEIFNGAPDANFDGVPDNCAPACPADLDGSGAVNGADLSILLGGWGSATGALNGGVPAPKGSEAHPGGIDGGVPVDSVGRSKRLPCDWRAEPR